MLRPGIAAFLVLFICLSSRTVSARETWMSYGRANEITDIAVRGNYIWCATNSGLVRWDKRDMSCRKFTMRDGLPHHSVNSIDIAADGSIWCATEAGAARFDGSAWQVFKMAGERSLYGTILVKAAPDGSVWVGTRQYVFSGLDLHVQRLKGGLYQFRSGVWTYYDQNQLAAIVTYAPDRSAYFPLTSIEVAPDSTLVFGSDSKGVGRYKDGVFSHWFGGAVTGVTTANGTVWAWAAKSIVKNEGEAWNYILQPEDLPPRNVSTLTVQPDGTLWVGTESNGLLRYDGTVWKSFTTANGLPDNCIRSLAPDDSGGLWIGTSDGLCSFDGTSFRTWKTEDELIGRQVTALAFDTNGTVWVGTPSGLSRYNGNQWRSFTTADGLPDNMINGIAVTPKGEVWIATPKGAARYYGSGWKVYTTADGLPENNITAAASGKDASVWFCTSGELIRFDGTDWVTYAPEITPRKGPYRNVSVAPDGTVWVWNSSDIVRFGGKQWNRFFDSAWFSAYPGGELAGITAANPGLDNTLYYLTHHSSGDDSPVITKHLYCFTDSYKYLCELPPTASSIGVDKNGIKWVAGYNNWWNLNPGALRIEGGSRTFFTEMDGLASRVVYTIAVAPDGAVWFGTENGLSRYGLPMTVGVESKPALPGEFAVVSSHPNPFNPSTTISFTLPRSARAELAVYSITGQKIRTLLSGPMDAGMHSAVWDGKDDGGETVSSGVYFSRLTAGKQAATGKMLMIK